MEDSIFTRMALEAILADAQLTQQQREDRLLALFGQAREAWAKEQAVPDPRDSEDYRRLAEEFADYKAMQQAREGDAFRDVKPKFFETVYGMVDRGDGADSLENQLKRIRGQFEEYFQAAPAAQPPLFGAPTHGSMPLNRDGAEEAFARAWGFGKKS